MFYGNRQVRTRLLGGVGAGGENPPATRLCVFCFHFFTAIFAFISGSPEQQWKLG